MPNQKVKSIYDALKGGGADVGTEQEFNDWFLARGDAGYENRKRVWDTMKAGGADVGANYEEFRDWLGLKAVKPQGRSQGSPQGRSLGSPQGTAPVVLRSGGGTGVGGGVPFRQDLTAAERDEIERRNGFAAQGVGRLRRDRQAAERRRSQPIADTGSKGADQYLVKTQGQWEDELQRGIGEMERKWIAPNVDSALADAEKEFFGELSAGTPMRDGDELFALRRANERIDPDRLLKRLQARLSATYGTPGMQADIEERARAAGMNRDEYLEEVLKPSLENALVRTFDKRQIEQYMPKDDIEYIVQGVGNSIGGMLMSAATETKGQRAYRNEAAALTEEGDGPGYHPGTGARLAQMGVSFAADAPFFGFYGKVGGNVAKRLVERQIKKLTAKGLSEGAARSIVGAALEKSVGARMKNNLMQHVVSSSLTMGGYNATSESARQARDSEFSPLQVAGSAAEGVATGAAFGFTGGAVQAVSQPLSGIARIGSKAGGYLVEGETMYATEELAKMVHGEEGFENPFEGSVEAMMKLGVMKVSSPGGLAKVADEVLHPVRSNRRQRVGMSFSKDEEAYVRESTGGRNLLESLSRLHPEIATGEVGGKRKLTAEGERLRQELAKNYADFMADKDIPYGVKEKVAVTLGGVVPDAAHTPLETGADIVHHADGTVTLKTRDKDGNCMQDIRFERFSDAEEWRDAHMDDFRMNDAVNMWNGAGEESRAAAIRRVMEEHGVDEDGAVAMVRAALNGSMGVDFGEGDFLSVYDAVHDSVFPADEPHVERSYRDGQALSPEERHRVMADAEEAERRLSYMDEAFAREVVDASEYADEKILELAGRDEVTREQMEAAIDYYNKRAMAEGMADKAMGSVDERVRAANAEVTRNTHKESGSLIQVSLYGGRYYVTAGRIRIGDDGYVVHDGSENTIVVRDAVTGEVRMLSPDRPLRVESLEDPARLKADNDSMEGLRGRLMDEVDSSISYAEGTPDVPIEEDLFTGRDGRRYLAMNTGTAESPSWVKVAVETDESGQSRAAGQVEPLDVEEYRQAKSDEIDADIRGTDRAGEGDGQEAAVGRWSLSGKKAGNGESFYQDASGSVDLAEIPQEVFDAIGYTKAPLRLTPSMLRHVQMRHGKETGITNDQEAIAFVLDVMNNFDHVRLGNDGALIFSVENGREKTGKRAITILLNSDDGDFYGIKTSGYEGVGRLSKRPLLWEGSAVITPSADAASATVPTLDDQQGGGQSGSASDQSNDLFGGKGTENFPYGQRKEGFSKVNGSDGQAAPEDTMAELAERYGEEKAGRMVATMAQNTRRAYEELSRKDTSKMTDMADLAAHEDALEEARRKKDYWEGLMARDEEQVKPGEKNYKLSEEKNEFGKPFVVSADGSTTFGEITADSGLSPAPIKLSLGENSVDENGGNHGYGLLHIEAGHGAQIRAAGFSSVEEFVESVARNYDTIREGNAVANNQTYLLEVSDEHNNTLFIQMSRDGSYWNVNSAGIFRKKYSRRMREVVSLPTIGNSSNTETVEVNRGQSKGVTATSENSSMTSGGKGTENFPNGQGNGEKVLRGAERQSRAAMVSQQTGQGGQTRRSGQAVADGRSEDGVYKARIQEWLSDENLEWAEGKSRDEIIEHFGNNLEPIASMPSGYLKHLGTNSSDNRVYSGKGYFIDHAVNHHDEEPIEEYLKINDILNHPDDVKIDNSKGRPTLFFIKKYGKYHVEMVSVGDDGTGCVVLHKSFFHRRKMPHKALPSVALEVSSADEVPAISPSLIGSEAGSSEFSALDDRGKGTENIPNGQGNGEKVLRGAERQSRAAMVSQQTGQGGQTGRGEPSAERQIAEVAARKAVGKTYESVAGDGSRYVMRVRGISRDGSMVTVDEQVVGRDGNVVRSASGKSYGMVRIGRALADGTMRRVATVSEKLERAYKDNRQRRLLVGVLSDGEQEELLAAHGRVERLRGEMAADAKAFTRELQKKYRGRDFSDVDVRMEFNEEMDRHAREWEERNGLNEAIDAEGGLLLRLSEEHMEDLSDAAAAEARELAEYEEFMAAGGGMRYQKTGGGDSVEKVRELYARRRGIIAGKLLEARRALVMERARLSALEELPREERGFFDMDADLSAGNKARILKPYEDDVAYYERLAETNERERLKALRDVRDAARRQTAIAFGEDEGVKPEEGEKEGAAVVRQPTGQAEEVQPVDRGVFGNVYDQFKGKAKEAIAFLLQKKEGEAAGALYHKDIGDISIVYGDKNGGLAHILDRHPNVLDNVQRILDEMTIKSSSKNRIVLESPTHKAVVSNDWFGKKVNGWLLTAYEKKSGVSGGSIDIVPEPEGKQNGTAPLQNANLKNTAPANTTDTGKTSDRGKRNDTATPQSTVSEGKGSENFPNGQGNGGEFKSDGANGSDRQEWALQRAEAETDTNPTDRQKEAGNYKKGHVRIDGFDITIENPKGSVRRGTDASGKQWEQAMQNTYGYIRRTEGVDGDHIDVFFSDDPSQGDVFVVDQVNKDGTFDEHKVMYGFPDIESARKAYLSNYEDGWQGLGAITPVSKEEFKKWVDSSHRKTKPFAEYKSVKPLGDVERQKATDVKEVNAQDAALRDAVVDLMRGAGIEVSTDWEEGQRVLDEANGRAALSRGKKRALETIVVPGEDKSPFKATGFSSADGAKVRNNLESFAKKSENLSIKKRNSFISDLADEIGAEKKGSDSRYAKFETKDGNEVLIRLADHHATVSGFDHNGEDNGISIVISRKPNEGITNDGKAHLVEIFYSDKALKKAEGNPYSEIVKSLHQALYSGEYKDNTGLAEREEVNADEIARYHKVKFFKTPDGEAYGYTYKGRIYMDPRIATAETPIHEYTHLWAEMKRQKAPGEWADIRRVLLEDKDVQPFVERVRRDYPELAGEGRADDFVEEVLTQFSGRKGAERLRQVADEIAREKGGVFGRAEAVTAIEKVRQVLRDFWRSVAEMLGWKYTSAEDVADQVLKDMLEGVNPGKSLTPAPSPNGEGSEKQKKGQGDSFTQEEFDKFRRNCLGKSVEGGEARKLLSTFKGTAERLPEEIDFTPENYDNVFGNGIDTPVGHVKMGENQREKMATKGRTHNIALAHRTLSAPDFILEKPSVAKEEQQTERPSSYVFVKTFTDPKGNRTTFYTSITVKKDGLEVSVSNYSPREKQVIRDMKEGKLAYIKEVTLPSESDTSTQGDQHTMPVGANSSVGKGSENSARFQEKDDKSLMGVHNISEEKLRKAIKQGGLANPSLAVVDTKNGMHSDFGKISLIPRASLIDARTGRNAGTYMGDAWTPTYPQVEKRMSEEGRDAFYKEVNGVSENRQLTGELKMAWDNYMDGRDGGMLAYWYLKERGMEPGMSVFDSGYTEEQCRRFTELTDNGRKRFSDMNTEDRDGILDLLAESKGMSKEELLAKYQAMRERNEELLKKEDTKTFRKNICLRQNAEIDKYGITLSPVSEFMYGMANAIQADGKPDVKKTLQQAREKMQADGMAEDFKRWLDEKEQAYGVKEMLFDGFTRDGDRKYIPNTVENASRMMNRESEANAGGQTGFGATRAVLLGKMHSLEDIRSQKGKLTGEVEDYEQRMEAASDEMFKVVDALSDMQQISDNPFSNVDYANARLQEALTKKDPIGYLNKEYGYDIDKDGDFAKGLAAMVETVENLPVKYFETKFRRPVTLDEFAVAVVPEGTSEDVVKALEDAGLDVRTYDGTEEGRTAATMEAVKGRDDIMFQKKKVRYVDEMADEERATVRKWLEEVEAIPATENTITKREGVSARNAAMEWAGKNIPEAKTVSTEIGGLVINKKSISDSLAHGFSQAKLDAIPTLVPAFEEGRAVYIGSGKDVNGNPITDHYFAYPIDYKGNREYVFCRTREDQNTHRLYIHEVITGEDIEKGQPLQSTAPEKPRTGLPLYRNIMSDIFGGKGTENFPNGQGNGEKVLRGSERDQRDRVNRMIDDATSLLTGRDVKAVRHERMAREEKRRQQAKEIYGKVLSGEINDVTLRQINEYIEDATPDNPYGRRISERLPQGVVRKAEREKGLAAVDALFSRISEGSVRPHERTREEGRRKIEERKKELLKQWAQASGHWHTDLSAFTDDVVPIGSGRDSDVYSSRDGRYVIKASKGKPSGKRFRPDIDNIPLFNSLFPDTAYEILGYGEIGGRFVRILRQPAVDFEHSEPLTQAERVAFMDGMGFHPINKKQTAFSNGWLIVADLQKGNVVKDGDGNIQVLDADCKLHTRDLGGEYEYPPVEHELPREEKPADFPRMQKKTLEERAGDDFNDALSKWKQANGLAADARAPKASERPVFHPGEDVVAYANRLVRYLEEDALWKTAPRLENYQGRREDRKVFADAMKEARKYPESLGARMQVMEAELMRLRRAVSRQRAYDRATVKAVTDFAQDFMRQGFGDNLGRGEMERMLSAVKNATGARNIRKEVDKVLDILVDNHLRNLEHQVIRLSSVKELKQTAQGVEAQGRLELKGQRMIQAFREARGRRMKAEDIRQRLSEVAEKMGRNDDEAPMWEQEYEGLSIALQYAENIEASRDEWAGLDHAYKDAVRDYKGSGRSYQAQQELLESMRRAMQENKMERIGMYGDIIGRLQGNISESMEGAREFVAREKARVTRIHRIVNLDLAGKEMGAMRKPDGMARVANSTAARFFLGPLATFEQMLRQFGSRNATGEGYLYDHFMRSWLRSAENAYLNEAKAKEELDARAREVFGRDVRRWSDLYELSTRPGAEVEVVDEGEGKTFMLTQGNMLYVYMANKMTDGAMKLRKMGITEGQVERLKEHIDPRLVQLGDWLQDEYLVRKRTEYNKVHERMFGAPMAAIDHYFPIRILGDARVQVQDVGNMSDQDAVLPSTITGSIVKRTRNALPLDILNTDALSLAIEHVEDMERWAAQAEWNKDVNTLLSYTTFRNKVKNMTTIYGSGDQLWNTFADTARMAAGTYRPKVKEGSVDKAASNIAKGVTAAKINFRGYTAFKQVLSAPAFLHDVKMGDFVKYSLNPYGSWKWAMENMPLFEKRWKSRQVGDTRLMDDATDWKMWKSNVVQMATRLGMTPNAFVDGITCAVGARAIYEAKYKKYRKMGATDERAHKRALQDAELGYNLTQQSSEGAFVSAIQKDRTVMANALSVFRNSSMAYTRQWVDAVRNLKHRMQKGYREDSIDFMARQFREELGLNEAQARKAAEMEYARAGRHEVAKMLNMMFGVTIAWNIGSSLLYLLLGDDDKTKEEMLEDAVLKGLVAGPTEGLAGGSIFSDFVGQATNEGVRRAYRDGGGWDAAKQALGNMGEQDVNPLPLFADLERMIGKMKYDGYAAAQDVFNICVQSAVGVNPQTFTDMWNACMDYGAPGWDGSDYTFDARNMGRAKEIALFMMRVMNAPTGSWRNEYIDELGMNAGDAVKLPYDEMARRYAHYKHWKDVPLSGFLRGEDARKEKMAKLRSQFDKAVLERMERLTDEELQDNLERSRDVDERRMYAKIIHQRIMGSGQDAKKATTDWQRQYQKLMTYEDLVDAERLSKRKLAAKEDGDEATRKLIEHYEKAVTERKKGLVRGSVPGEELMRQIRTLRKEALEKAGVDEAGG